MCVFSSFGQAIQPRIYVACLAAYNNGILHGAWIDALREPWAIWEDVRAVLASSPIPDAEEWAIHDYEGFGGIAIGEYIGIDAVAQMAAFLIEYGSVGAAVLDYFSGDVAEARETMTERYLGQYQSLADYMQEMAEEQIAVPAQLRLYIDWEAMANDAVLSGDIFALQTALDVVHVFSAA